MTVSRFAGRLELVLYELAATVSFYLTGKALVLVQLSQWEDYSIRNLRCTRQLYRALAASSGLKAPPFFRD